MTTSIDPAKLPLDPDRNCSLVYPHDYLQVNTIFEVIRKADDTMPAEWTAMVKELFRSRFTDDTLDRATAIAAYERHNEHVRATAPADRLVQWQPGDGWAPLCGALGVAIPDEPFPHVNSTAEFRAMVGLDT